jgi:FkbM family methyltransferase
LRTLANLGFAPRFCVDIGAYNGDWTRLCRSVFPTTSVYTTLADAAPGFITAELALLGAQNGAVVEFIEMETGSSVYEERSHYNRRKVLKVTKTLDDLLTERHAPAVDLLKLDVQGYELEVLKGASAALAEHGYAA